MKGFPLFSNFDTFVRDEFDSRKGNPLKVSQFNIWVRMMSAVGDGLIIYSNTDHKLFKAAGDINVNTIYGGQSSSGVIGVDWNGKPIYAGTMDVPLKPNPIVKSISINEGVGNISRKASISMTVFTKEQADLMAEYFLEPGFTVFFEFGWNNVNALHGLVDITSNNPETIAKNITDMQNFTSLVEKRRKSKGAYDNYLGYITAGNITINGEAWDVSVELVGFNEIPYYLMNRDVIGLQSDTIKPAEIYGNVEDEDDPFKRRFKIMFNDLPAKRRTKLIKSLENQITMFDLINFDERVVDEINKMEGKRIKIAGEQDIIHVWYTYDASGRAVRHEKKVGKTDKVEIPSNTKIVNSERFISMRLAMKILELNAESIRLANGNKVKLNVDIDNTIIKAFKHIYSTDKSKLLIPNSHTPGFSLSTALSDGNISLKTISNNVMDNSFGDYIFPWPVELHSDGTFSGNTTSDVAKEAYEWGFLKHLYINFDFFIRTINVETFVLSDILKTLLNGLSDAVSSYWDFQIFEREDVDGNMTLQIVDVEFTTKTETENIYEFSLLGEQSILLSNSFNIDIPSAMANKIIGERLGTATQSTLKSTGLFTTKTDRILLQMESRNQSSDDIGSYSLIDNIRQSSIPNAPYTDKGRFENINRNNTEADDEIKELTIETYLDNTGIFPKPLILPEGIQLQKQYNFRNIFNNRRVVTEPTELEYYVVYGTYNDTQLFDGIYNASTSNSIKRTNDNQINEYSTLLPLTFSFSVHGISGIRRGDKFKVSGLPDLFIKDAFFQITSIEQTVDNGWVTTITGALRRAL